MSNLTQGTGPAVGTSQEHQPPGQNKTVDIIINGKAKEFQGKKISFQEVVTLAFGTYEDKPTMINTVTYSKAEGNKEGTMVKGDEIPVKDGMEFIATQTDKS